MHLPVLQTIIFSKNNKLFTFPRPLSWQLEGSSGWRMAKSQAIVCPVCLDCWAKLHVAGFDIFEVRGHPCELHQTDVTQVAGSLFSTFTEEFQVFDKGLWEHLQEELLDREVALTFRHVELYKYQLLQGE